MDKLTWYLNEHGNIQVWQGERNFTNLQYSYESDIYIQSESEKKLFFESIGLDYYDINAGTAEITTDYGYFIE